MSLLTIIGILLVGGGTLFVALGSHWRRVWTIALGAVATAAGTWLTISGQQRVSKAETAEIRSQVDSVLTKIDEATAELPPAEAGSELANIRRDFVDWATDFEKNRTKKALERNQELLQQQVLRLEYASPAKETIEYTLGVLRGSLLAYARETGRPIRVDFLPIPDNIAEQSWTGRVEFNPDVAWDLDAASYSYGEFWLQIAPVLGEEDSNTYFALSIDLHGLRFDGRQDVTPYWRTFVRGDYFLPKEELETVGILGEDRESLVEILQRLIAIQILIIDEQ